MEVDLFGNEIVKDILLRDKFIVNPFSVFETYTGDWQKRKNIWKSKGIKSEVGRDVKANANVHTFKDREITVCGFVSVCPLHKVSSYHKCLWGK